MNNKNILYCILGSLILVFFGTAFINDVLIRLPNGYIFCNMLVHISSLGILLLIVFSITLIINNIILLFKREIKK